jgi:hypothetical protein
MNISKIKYILIESAKVYTLSLWPNYHSTNSGLWIGKKTLDIVNAACKNLLSISEYISAVFLVIRIC